MKQLWKTDSLNVIERCPIVNNVNFPVINAELCSWQSMACLRRQSTKNVSVSSA